MKTFFAIRRHNPRSGIALIIVLIAITMLSILAGLFAYSMKVETKLAQNANSEAELIWLGRSGVEYAKYVLALQASVATEQYNSLNQVWAGGPGTMAGSNSPLSSIKMSDYELGDGKFSIKIEDLERKVNINIADEMMLQQALRLMGVDAGDYSTITGSILDWIDADDSTHIGGAESDYYQGLTPQHDAKNGPVDDMTELLLVKGVTPEVYWGGVATNHLSPAAQRMLGHGLSSPGVTGYPIGLVNIFTPFSNGKININTASAAVLQMIPGVDENAAAEIIKLRAGPDGADGTEDDTPYTPQNLAQNLSFIPGLSVAARQQVVRICTTLSSTFEVQIDAEVAGYRRQFTAILSRPAQGSRECQVLSFQWK